MTPVDQIDGKIEAEGKLYFYDSFWKKLKEITEEPLLSLLEEPEEELGWYDIQEYKLDNARSDERIWEFPPGGGDCILVLSLDGSAEIKFESPGSFAFDLETYKKLRHSFTDLYLTNTAQAGKKLKLLFSKGNWELKKTVPEIDLQGTIRNDYLDQTTDPLKIGQIIKDGHIVPHADIACEKILISGTKRLDEWRSTEDYTYIAPGMILLKSTTKLSDWQHPSNMTFIHGGQIYTSSITAAKLSITDLADIANLLTIAEGKIIIGEDVLGTDLHGIKIVDEQATPVTRVEIGHLASGVENYGINVRDPGGNLTIEHGLIKRAILAGTINNQTGSTTTSTVYTDMQYMTFSLVPSAAGYVFLIGHMVLWRSDDGIIFTTFKINDDDQDSLVVGEASGAGYRSTTMCLLKVITAQSYTFKIRWKVAASTGNVISANLIAMIWYY